MLKRVFSILLLTFLLAACIPVTPTESGNALQPSPVFSLTPDEKVDKVPSTPTPAKTSNELVIWLPAQFVSVENDAEQILYTRLEQFMEQHPGYTVTVRLKDAAVENSFLESLALTSTAAPQSLPSLVLLDRFDLEKAVSEKLISPFSQPVFEKDKDWYDFAHQLAQVSERVYGLPLAGDALILVYHPQDVPTEMSAAIDSWNTLITLEKPVAFIAADSKALLSFALYLSAGGQLQSSESIPEISKEVLSAVYLMYEQGARDGVFPGWIPDLENDDQAWQRFKKGDASFLVTTVNSYILNQTDDCLAQPLPALNQGNYTLMNGWMWAISEPDAQRRVVSEELAQFLTAPEFLTEWTAAAGFLPVRPSVMEGWTAQSMKTLLGRVILSAQEIPSYEVISTLGVPLRDGAVEVLEFKISALQAASQIAESINPEE